MVGLSRSNNQATLPSRIPTFLLTLAIAMISSGCSIMAPPYSPSPENLQLLRDGGKYTACVAEFGSQPGEQNENPISIRGNTINSPYNGSYAGYLAEALRQELAMAGKWSQSAETAVTGTVLTNTVHAPPASTGTVDIKVRFAVVRGSRKSYEQDKSVHHEFPSEFAGPIAIPRAIQEYQFAVHKLLAELYRDQAFVAALKSH